MLYDGVLTLAKTAPALLLAKDCGERARASSTKMMQCNHTPPKCLAVAVFSSSCDQHLVLSGQCSTEEKNIPLGSFTGTAAIETHVHVICCVTAAPVGFGDRLGMAPK